MSINQSLLILNNLGGLMKNPAYKIINLILISKFGLTKKNCYLLQRRIQTITLVHLYPVYNRFRLTQVTNILEG